MTFKRTWEKVLAWIANVLLILVAIPTTFIVFSNSISEVLNNDVIKMQVQQELLDEGAYALNYSDLVNALSLGFKVWAIVIIIASHAGKNGEH